MMLISGNMTLRAAGAAIFCVIIVLGSASVVITGVSGTARATPGKKTAIVWMGLEITGENITSDLSSLSAHRTDITGVSYEHCILDSTGDLVAIPLVTNVTNKVRSFGLDAYPMIISASLSDIEYLLAHPSGFIQSAVSAAIGAGYTGYNIDFEPTQAANATVAIAYAKFLSTLADALHAHGKKLTVDIATWNPFWNFADLANTTVNALFDMSTYASPFFNFGYALSNDVASIPLSKLGIGLITVNVNNGTLLPGGSVSERFKAIESENVTSVAVWDMPLASYWWNDLSQFIGNGVAISTTVLIYSAGLSAVIAVAAVGILTFRRNKRKERQ